jgi:hypothetical protein
MGHKPNIEKSSQTGPSAKQTPEELIHELRMNVKSLLFVPKHQIEALLAEYDKMKHLAIRNGVVASTLNTGCLALEAEKKTMTETILGLTQKVQELESGRLEDIIRIASVAQEEKGVY